MSKEPNQANVVKDHRTWKCANLEVGCGLIVAILNNHFLRAGTIQIRASAMENMHIFQ